MNFSKIELSGIGAIREYLDRQNSRMADYTVGALYIWADYLETEYCILDDTLFLRFFDRRHGHFVYAYPITSGDITVAISRLLDCVQQKHALVLAAVPKQRLEELEMHYSIKYHFKRDWSDYLYEASQLREYKGKKFHDKRNHMSRFGRDYGEYSYHPITQENLGEALQLLDEYKKNGENNSLFRYELRKSREVLRRLEQLGLEGGMIKVGDKVVGVSAGEMVGDTLFVHIEKALREYNGVYAVLANAFAKQFQNALYINREDDAGDLGLRKSKLSYNPITLVDKYIVYLKPLP